MTNITADYFRNTKIKILSPEHSKQVQEAVFAVGGKWVYGNEVVRYVEEDYLFIDNRLLLSWGGQA